jgi:hypothetical protein
MKKSVLGVCVLLTIVSTFLFFQWNRHRIIGFHQIIDINEVTLMKTSVGTYDPLLVSREGANNIVEWFNSYPAAKVKEQADWYNNPTHEAVITITLISKDEVRIYYVEGLIFVSRTDVKDDREVQYVFMEDAPELESYFLELIKR